MDKDQAQQFALILTSGVPPLEALRYMLPDMPDGELKAELQRWMRDPAVQKAILALQGKAWEGMSLEERITFAVEKHYSEVAYFLYAHNYADLVGAERQKADTCRQVLEAKLAGLAGKMDALTRFYDDLMKGRQVQRPGVPNAN